MENGQAEEFAALYAKNFGEEAKLRSALAMLSEALKAKGGHYEAYLRHNIAVASTVLSLGFDRNAVLAGLLHNAGRSGIDLEKIGREFGKAVAELIAQQQDFERALGFKGDRESARKKFLIVLSSSPSVVALQLSEMLDKIRNLSDVPEQERAGFVSEIKELYAPLAHRLGIYAISSEMNELAFRFEQPQMYEKIQASIDQAISKTSWNIEQTKKALEEALAKAGLKAQISGRVKTAHSTHQKMRRNGIGIGRIYDLMALRMITGSEKDCYEALGIIHSLWKPIPGEFDDYIAKPKENGYRSLHTSVFTSDGIPVEIQIRTSQMHDFAEFGMASHWAYKGMKADSRNDRKIEWIKQLIEWEKSSGEKTESDIFGKEVFAMTPNGDVIELPYGATILDFAYAVHTDLGDKCHGARVNGVMCALNTQIRNGDVVEILTSQKQAPKMGWLGFVKTAKARQKIKARLHIAGSEDGPKSKPKPRSGMATNDRRIRLAKCCLPLPGDEIIGFRTTKRKIAVHRADCAQAVKMRGKIDVYWGGAGSEYEAQIVAEGTDRIGLLKDILDVFTKNRVRVKATSARAGAQNNITCNFSVSVRDLGELEQVIKKISAIKGVTHTYRE